MIWIILLQQTILTADSGAQATSPGAIARGYDLTMLAGSDLSSIKIGDIVFEVVGSQQSILKSERLVLNAMQRMSAISTKTAKFVNLLNGTKTKILDTRKTTPGIRALEKWAVSIGGGVNHRFALYDMIMLKDNHVDFSGGITSALDQTVKYLNDNNLDLEIIVEARNITEIDEILGDNEGVTGVRIVNNKSGDKSKIDLSGVFVAIGHVPNTQIFENWLEKNSLENQQTACFGGAMVFWT